MALSTQHCNDTQSLTLVYEGLVSQEDLQASAAQIKQGTATDVRFIVIELSNAMFTAESQQAFVDETPLTIARYALSGVLYVLPGTVDTPLAEQLWEHHSANQTEDCIAFFETLEQAQDAMLFA